VAILDDAQTTTTKPQDSRQQAQGE